MEGPSVWNEASREERRVITLCFHYLSGYTEKQDVRDLRGLLRSRDPGEGELAVYELGGELRGAFVWDQEGDRRVRIYMSRGEG